MGCGQRSGQHHNQAGAQGSGVHGMARSATAWCCRRPGRQGHHSSAALAVVPLWGLGEQAEADLSEIKSERKMS